MSMIIDNRKFDIACANNCLAAYKVLSLAKVSTCILPRIRQGKALRASTVGKIAKALGVSVTDLLQKN